MQKLFLFLFALILATGQSPAQTKQHTPKLQYGREDLANGQAFFVAPAPGGVYFLVKPSAGTHWALYSHLAGERKLLHPALVPLNSFPALDASYVAWISYPERGTTDTTTHLHLYEIETGKQTQLPIKAKGAIRTKLLNGTLLTLQHSPAEYTTLVQYSLLNGQELWREDLPAQRMFFEFVSLPQGLLLVDPIGGAWRWLNPASRTFVGPWVEISSILLEEIKKRPFDGRIASRFHQAAFHAHAGMRGENHLFVVPRLGGPRKLGLLELDPQGREVSREALLLPEDYRKFLSPFFRNTVLTSDGILTLGIDGRIARYDELR